MTSVSPLPRFSPRRTLGRTGFVATAIGIGMEAVDLFVFHAVSQPSAWEAIAAPGGPLDELDRCIRDGKARFRGISSHHPEVLRRALATGRCDVVMFPVGPACDPRYVEEILPLARSQGVGTVCFKSFGAGKLLGDTEGYGRPLQPGAGAALPRLGVDECVRYTLTVDPDVALLGMSSPEEQDAALAAAAAFAPMGAEELAVVRRKAALAVAGKGRLWWDPA